MECRRQHKICSSSLQREWLDSLGVLHQRYAGNKYIIEKTTLAGGLTRHGHQSHHGQGGLQYPPMSLVGRCYYLSQ